MKGLTFPPMMPLTEALTYRVGRLSNISDRLSHLMAEREFSISLNELRVIGLTFERGPIRASALADELFMDKSQLSRLVKLLVGKRLLIAVKSPQDARAVDLSLSDEGKAMHRKVLAEVARNNRRIGAPLTPQEVARYLEMTDRLTEQALAMLR
ncbi:MAG: MarR family winged helix-turn-helix transcriptional regulator [Sulfitobacter sp.]